MENTRIYIAFHRDGKVLSDDKIYARLQVGKSISRLNLEMENDASGISISDKNDIYSELTGWYWIWKNQKHDYVGTCHYRRYFTVEKPSVIRRASKMLLFLVNLYKKRHGLFYVNNTSHARKKILNSEQIISLMQHYDAILPKKKKFRYSVYEQYRRRHNEKDILITREIIREKHGDYVAAFDETFQSHEMYAFNMFLLPWHLFDKYMEWLFSILSELEKRADIDRTDKYQKRVCAFMAERLLTVWFNRNELRIKELNILYFKKLKAGHY